MTQKPQTSASASPSLVTSDSKNYFLNFKKGEINDLLESLRASALERNSTKQRSLIKTVISNMTLGRDVSSLFSEMIMASNTRDLVQKRLVYQYLCNYAEAQSELSILVINTLLKDCCDGNFMVRALAVRAISSLKLPNLMEYLVPPVLAALRDPAPHVRKSAILGVTKLYHIAPKELQDRNVLPTILALTKDKDPQVVINALCALNEIHEEKGNFPFSRELIIPLLVRLKDFNEWGQTYLLDVMYRIPVRDQEIFDIMNLLEERLKHSSLSIVFAAARLFIHYGSLKPKLMHAIIGRLKSPLLLLMTSGGPEQAFVCLQHLSLLIQRAPQLFYDEYKTFYFSYDDPTYIKLLKIEILTAIVNESSLSDVLQELSEYARDRDGEVSNKCMKALEKIAGKLPESSESVVTLLLSFVNFASSPLEAYALLALKDLVRRFPHHSQLVVPLTKRCLRTCTLPEAREALVWLLGEYGERQWESVYLVEYVVDGYEKETPMVKKQLLSTTFKLLIKRPSETKPVLSTLMRKTLADFSHRDLHDLALLYSRLLISDPNLLRNVVGSPSPKITVFSEDKHVELQDQLFHQFNTLAVVYGLTYQRILQQEDHTNRKPELLDG